MFIPAMMFVPGVPVVAAISQQPITHQQCRPRKQRGMVTVEFAVALIVVALVACGAAFVVQLVVVQARCGDTAAAVARQIARGDDQAAAKAKATAPKGASVTIVRSGNTVDVRVAVSEKMGIFGPFHLSGSMSAVAEPGVKP